MKFTIIFSKTHTLSISRQRAPDAPQHTGEKNRQVRSTKLTDIRKSKDSFIELDKRFALASAPRWTR